MKRVSYLIGFAGILIGIFLSVRAGALTIASALAILMVPDFRQMRLSEKIIPAVLFVSLITIALALPRR